MFYLKNAAKKVYLKKLYSMSFTDDIRGLISKGRTREALEQLAQWVEDKDNSLSNELILLQSQWNQNERSERMGLLSSQELSMYRARINMGLLSLLEEVEKLERKNPASSAATSAYTSEEIKGLEEQRDLLIRKLNFLKKERDLAVAADAKFALDEQIEELEQKIQGIKDKLKFTSAPGPHSAEKVGVDADKVKIFISYAHEDREWVEKLGKHLAVLKRRYVESWTDSEILPGDSWNEEIRRKLNEADVILLLVSPDFLNSEFIYNEELPVAWKRHKARETIVIPIILRPSTWDLEEYASLQALPRGARPISQWPNEDEAFVDVVGGLRKVIEAKLKITS